MIGWLPRVTICASASCSPLDDDLPGYRGRVLCFEFAGWLVQIDIGRRAK